MNSHSELDVDVVGDSVRYADGSESTVIRILESANDRSSVSDELAAHIQDWPTRYHLSPERSHLFSPISFPDTARILEIGCGTGVNLRVLGERGHEVVGIEGDSRRAFAARTRTADLSKVTIFSGDIADFKPDHLFDAVVVIGVLEYISSGIGKISSPEAFLELCKSLLEPDGVIILAIENQLGLKYLLSYPEDHVGLPWIGLEGYSGSGPRTWSRNELSSLLRKAGFSEQQWLHPFPDYKLPSLIFREQIYDTAEGREIVRNFLRQPVVDHSGDPLFTCNAHLAHQEFLRAGLGDQVPNSFLVVAGSSVTEVNNCVDPAEGWIVSALRRSEFRSLRRFVRDGDRYRLNFVRGPSSDEPSRNKWLTNRGHKSELVYQGVPLDILIAESIRKEDENGVRQRVRQFWDYLITRSTRTPEDLVPGLNPFVLEGDTYRLSGELIDCGPQNLIADEVGDLTAVDHEWVVDGECSTLLIFARGLLVLAQRLITEAVSLYSIGVSEKSIVDIVRGLAGLIDVDLSDEVIDSLLTAEYSFQCLVSVGPELDFNEFREYHLAAVARPRKTPTVLELLRLANDRDRVVADRELVVADRDRVVADREYVEKQRAEAIEDISRLQLEVRTLRESRSFKIGRLVTRPFSVLFTPFRRNSG